MSQIIKNLMLTAILISILISCGGNNFSMKFDRLEKEKDPKVLEKLELYESYNYPIQRQILIENKVGVHILTAHSSK